ncbi:MAG: class I SAM-dependent methyltransferase, partial [Spirochaetota bacterium]
DDTISYNRERWDALSDAGVEYSQPWLDLDARVVVLDISERQLEKDRAIAAHYNLQVRTEQGDMQDLSRFARTAG